MADTQTGATTLVGAFQGGTEMCMAVAAGGSRCDWLQPTPVTGTVAAAASAPLSVRLDAATLPEQPSTNTADLVFTGTFVNSPPPLPVTFLVIPGDLGVTPAGTVTSSGTVGGPFAPVSQVYTLTNGSAAPLTWSAASTSAWLLVAPTGGLLAAGGTAAVTASLNEAIAAGLSVGDYTGRVAFTNHTGGEAPQRPWLLRVGAAAPLAIYSFPLDTDPGWTREGQWAFGKPQALGGDPATGHTGTNVFGYNLAGAYPNSMPVYYLTTGPLDFTGWTGVTLRLWRWLGVEAAVYDDAGLEISTNGVTWLPVWTHTGASFQDTAWQEVSYSLSAYADQCPNVRLRWSMGPTDSSVTYSGWNIDDITLEGRSPQTMAMARLDATPSAQSVPENAAAATVTVVRSQATTSEVSVAYATSNGTATAGEDYVATTGVLSFAANQTSAVVVISLLDDLSPEGDETFQLRLSQPSSNALLGTAEATITLLDGETPDLVRFAAATQTVGEAAITVAVAVVRSGPNGGAFSVPYAVTGGTAVAGADYLAGTGVVAFGAGQNTQFLGVVLLDDAVPEPLRTVLVNLGPPVGGPVLGVPTQQVIQIVDDEGAVTNLPLSLYDGGAYLWDIQQNGSIYNGSSDAYDTGLVLAGFPSFPNALLIGGREVLIGTSTSGALRITRRIYVPADQAYARFLEIMVNTAPTAVTVTVELDTNLGSDSSTISVGTSDGDTVFTTNDDWIVTDDTDGSGDPTVLQVVANGGGLIRPYAATQSGDSMSYDYRWTLGPGETGIVMHVAAQNPNRATALAKGPQLAALQLNLLAGLSSGEVSRIVNFGPSGVLAVLPSGRDYGAHPVGSSTDGDFVVTNTGAGLVTGTATASAPFSVVLGEAYSLPAGSAQVVRVRFSPVAAGLFSNTVVFTGGGGAVRPVSGRAIGLGDTDGDGFSDWNEYIAGTAETNAADYLHFLNGFTIEAPKRLVYEWDSVTGRWYTIIVCTNFKGGVWMPQGGLPGTGARVRVTNAPPDAWELGLRLGVELTP